MFNNYTNMYSIFVEISKSIRCFSLYIIFFIIILNTSSNYLKIIVKEKLREDADCEIATTMLKVSLNCPLGKMKMSIPCRASTCSHLQCFDANLYLQMNERKPTWNCPVCDRPAAFDNLVIDG